MNKIIECALNFLFPKMCGFCEEMGNNFLCEDCKAYLNAQKINIVLDFENTYFESYFGIFHYENEVRESILNYKFNGKSYLYKAFVKLIVSDVLIMEYIDSFDFIIPVPIHYERYKKRGYNQSELIVKEICLYNKKIIYIENVLRKVSNIKAQSTLSKEERVTNVQNAYVLGENSRALKDKKILIFDDVFTTGSTVNECSRILRQSGCSYIGVLTLAKD